MTGGFYPFGVPFTGEKLQWLAVLGPEDWLKRVFISSYWRNLTVTAGVSGCILPLAGGFVRQKDHWREELSSDWWNRVSVTALRGRI